MEPMISLRRPHAAGSLFHVSARTRSKTCEILMNPLIDQSVDSPSMSWGLLASLALQFVQVTRGEYTSRAYQNVQGMQPTTCTYFTFLRS